MGLPHKDKSYYCAWRPDMIIKYKKQTGKLINLAVPYDNRVDTKEIKKKMRNMKI